MTTPTPEAIRSFLRRGASLSQHFDTKGRLAVVGDAHVKAPIGKKALQQPADFLLVVSYKEFNHPTPS